MKIAKRVFAMVLAIFMLSAALAGCADRTTESGDGHMFASYKDIPGVTPGEIEAIEDLRNSRVFFNYASIFGNELFYTEGGDVRGFSALICNWLTGLFDIPFVPGIVEWDELIPGLESGAIDFTGNLTANDERRKKFFMTDDIAQRQIIKVHLVNEKALLDIAEERDLRYAFLDGATTANTIIQHGIYSFESVFVSDFDEAYEKLKSGEADAFFCESSAEAAFDFYGELFISTYFPIIYTPVSLTAFNPKLQPIISVVQKALDNGAISHLTELYNEGHKQYLRQKLFLSLTEEERAYIKSNPVVPFAAEITNYPISFFDSRTNEWEGIAHDVIHEIENITGLTFERQNDENTHWPELLEMLESGRVAMITELIPSENRKGKFLWPEEAFFRDHFVLVSRSEFRDININEILYVKTGIAKDTAHSILFQSWFPNHRGIVEYNNTFEAFDALERGEIDAVMTSEHQLLIMTSYRELVGYKAYYVFDFYYDSVFGLNIDETVLNSIITKAMKIIDVERISGRWLRMTYDYRVRLAQERMIYILVGGLLSAGLVFTVILLVRKRKVGTKLEKLVGIRTKELSENQRQINDILLKNEFQLMLHNLMLKATKIGLWDMPVNKDDPVNPNNEFFWSDEFRSLLGFTDESDFPNILSSWSDRLHPDDKAATLEAFYKHLTDKTGKTPYDLEYRLQKKDGQYAYYRVTGETIRDEEGNAERVAGALLDVNETRQLLLDLETESSMLQTMFDSIPDLIFCKDTNHNYTRCNKSFLKYFQITEGDIVGKDVYSGLKLSAAIAEESSATDNLVMDEKRINTYEEYVPTPDGKMRLFETSKVPLFLGGKITGIMGISRDITERKAMEEAAQSANRAKSEFLASMSHEIRTRMNAIIGMSEILASEKLNNRQMSYVKDISASSLALVEIINDILDMSKIEAGKLELAPVDYNFEQFIDNIVSMFTHVAANKGLAFHYERAGEIPDCLYGDDIRLRQILTNICGNAVKFTEKGHVRLAVEAKGQKLVFKVADTGLGIHKEDLPRMFTAFEQFNTARNRRVVGTGLGLPICKTFVEMMDGEITVESEYGRGSVFTVTIPIVEGNPENIRANEPDRAELSIKAPDAKILVTDDNEFNLRVAIGLLRFMEIEAETAYSGDSAIKLVHENDYDIIFMDHMMPGKDGVETVKEIRALGGKYKDLKIIALTANAVTGAREMFLENGFDDFLSKPVNASELRDTVRRHLPTGKIEADAAGKKTKAKFYMEEELRRKTIVTFVKENEDTYRKIADSLSSGDIKTAHRIAHTLKSSAGYLGKKELQEVASSLEQSLQDMRAGHTPEQLAVLERELAKALDEYRAIVIEEESGKSGPAVKGDKEVEALLLELEPLLKKNDFGAVDYVEELRDIAGMEKLAGLIDDYDFDGALLLLEKRRDAPAGD